MEFRSDFVCGNGKLVEYQHRDGAEYILFIAEQKFSESKPVWFDFRISGLTEKKVIFRIGNAHQFLADGPVDGFTGGAPVYRAPGGSWKRTGKCSVTFEDDGFPIVEFVIDECPDNVEVAFCYPYGPEQLEDTAARMEGFRRRCIGYSTKGNPIYRFATDGGKKTCKPGLYLTSRQHAQEVGGAWVLDGVLRYFGSEEGKPYRDRLAIWATPMVDVDGVIYGAYGKDQAIGDMNRSWSERFQKRTEIDCVVQDLERWSGRCRPKIIMDLHSPAHEVLDMLVNIPTEHTPEHQNRMEHFIDMVNGELAGTGLPPFRRNRFVQSHAVGSSQGSGGMMTQYTTARFGIPTYTLEMTYEGSSTGRLFEPEDYTLYGKCVAIAAAKILLDE